MDAELLAVEYDAVIVGTGMAEAILAGALARAGKKVLHVDQNDYYGSNYASFPLEQFLRWTRNEPIAAQTFESPAPAPAPAAAAASDEAARRRVVPLQSSFRCELLEQAFNVPEDEQQSLLRQSSHFSIDVNPRLVLSSEEIVQILITSGVGRYLEFAAMEGTYVHLAGDGDTVWQVPCSKKDVFSSKLLGMVEKRMLMKFLQFVADYGETEILGEDVKSKNERELALGRALKRPQNKANQVDETLGASGIEHFLDRPFQELLQQHFKLSAKLQQVVLYCVALASFPMGTGASGEEAQQLSAREGLAAVYRYVASIGRFTGNAFLVPLYGVSEITQSFCRLCAVYGGIYVLRAPIEGLVIDDESGRATVVGLRCQDGGIVKAQHVIVNASYLAGLQAPSNIPASRVLRGVLLLQTSLRAAMNRFMVVIPPQDAELENPFAVHVIQLDHGAYVCPKDYFLVQITTPLPSQWHEDTQRQQQLMDAIARRLIESALAEANASTRAPAATDEGSPTPPAACWRDVIAWKAVYTMEHQLFHYSHATKQAPYISPPGLPSNLWVCETTVESQAPRSVVHPLELPLESACVNARAIFEALCPGEAFLPKSASAEQAEREELEDEQDAVLKAAKQLAEKADISSTAIDTDHVTPVTTTTEDETGNQEHTVDNTPPV
ncbi:hypothetical protein P43SY_004503 [Pythium insidiosum]|uniref:Rab proteins geranylgeranyltransferase component n=1 Tax=Pythium insidiosum TaxID=114742 RepID=A0AAD5LK67_PYTIN|nr:hypothetical protein P43SY_004503 [Pythium insidiosum]